VKVGDLVTMPGPAGLGGQAIGIVARMVPPALDKMEGNPRAGILWSDGGGRLDWEPIMWLEVISESR
jgi:hypothetical protein